MFIYTVRARHARAPVVLISLVSMLGCSADDSAKVATDPSKQAQAAQASIESAKAAHDHDRDAPDMEHDKMAAAPSAPMAGGAAPGGPAMNMPPPASGTPEGMGRMLGQPPMTASGSKSNSGLPAAAGAPHIYHLGADTFFLDLTSAIELTGEQQKKLNALRENATVNYGTAQRKIDQGEQDLWVLSSSEAPDLRKIEAKINEIGRLSGQQRVAFIRTVGDAVGVLSETQRQAVASQPGAMPPAASAGGAPPPAGMAPAGAAPSNMPAGMAPAAAAPAPMKMGDKPVKMGDKPMKMGDKPVKMGDKPMKMGDKPDPAGGGMGHM